MNDSPIPTLELLGLWTKHGQYIFADQDNYVKWLESPGPFFGNVSPLDFVEQGGSYERIEYLLGCLVHGIVP